MVTEQILFVLNFGRHPWKEYLKVQIEIPRLEEFLIGLQKSWEKAMMKSMEAVQEVNRKRRNSQGLKVGDNM